MPARYESYNLLERIGPENIFTADFLRSVDRTRPLSRMTEVWTRAHAETLINRMLALDLKYTLADADLPRSYGCAIAQASTWLSRCWINVSWTSRRRSHRSEATARAATLLLQAGPEGPPARRDHQEAQAWLRLACRALARERPATAVASGDALQSLGNRNIVRPGSLRIFSTSSSGSTPVTMEQ